MDPDSTGSLRTALIILVLLLFSSFFSASETALTSASKARLKAMEKDGNKRASLPLKFIEEYDRILSTILVGNNLVNILASSLCTVLFTALFGTGGVGYATLIMTVFILLFGEITPKTLAKQKPEKAAILFSPILNIFKILLTPVTWLFGFWQKALDRHSPDDEPAGLTGDELSVLVEEGEKEGALDSGESELIQSAIDFDDTTVRKILTPRVDAVMFDTADTPEELFRLFREYHHSRIPVYTDSVDNVVGIIHEKDFYPSYLVNPSRNPVELARPALFVPDTMKISALLTLLRKKKTHIAVVIDQYGGVMGIVTMEDVLEELVGEIYDESDQEPPEIQPLGEGLWKVSGTVSIEDVFDTADVPLEDTETESTSIGGLVIELAGEFPSVGAVFDFQRLRLTVKEIAHRRIEWLEVQLLPPAENEE